MPAHPRHDQRGVSFNAAMAAWRGSAAIAGIGIKLGPIPGTDLVLFGVDWDGDEPPPSRWPKATTYVERSPSGGHKFHVLGIYKGVPLETKKTPLGEVYTCRRFFTCTGDRISGRAIVRTDPRPYYAFVGVGDPQPYGGTGSSTRSRGEPVAESDLTPKEREWLDQVADIRDDDLSLRDWKVCAQLLRLGATDEEAARVLRAGFWRDKLARDDYVFDRTITKLRAELAEAFREESKELGEGREEAEQVEPIYTLAEMRAEFVLVADGSQVVPRSRPRTAYSFPDFKNLTAASTQRPLDGGRPTLVANKWMADVWRKRVDTRTFRAGAPLFCQSPDDRSAINTWSEPLRDPPPKNWREYAKAFFDHLEYLIPIKAEREALLDWLAHIEQFPGVLPHFHFLLYAARHGLGRNWVSGVLARMWRGSVALDVNLPALLDGAFNGRLSRKILAVINEVREGAGANAYRYADALRALLTDETRLINPKYGRQHVEFNSTRFLMFSNHANALPLDRFDRRIYAIESPSAPRSAAYYTRLYRLAADPSFVAAVREVLRTRDIGAFNPGMVAPMSATKQKVIEASMSEADLEVQHLVASYPSDCITSGALADKLADAGATRGAGSHIARRFDVQQYGGGKKVRVRGKQDRVWILRNADRWANASPQDVAKEVERGVALEGKKDFGHG